MMAGQRQPIELVVANGKKHLTKSEIEDRRNSEIKAPSDKIKPPSYLPKDLKKEFKEISKQLIELDIMSNLDVDALSRFLISKKLYLEISCKLLENPELLLDKDMLNAQDKLFKQCRQGAADLGLTISSRCKLVIPKKSDDKPKNKFSKFGAENG